MDWFERHWCLDAFQRRGNGTVWLWEGGGAWKGKGGGKPWGKDYGKFSDLGKGAGAHLKAKAAKAPKQRQVKQEK